jgi:hypothetical protein
MDREKDLAEDRCRKLRPPLRVHELCAVGLERELGPSALRARDLGADDLCPELWLDLRGELPAPASAEVGAMAKIVMTAPMVAMRFMMFSLLVRSVMAGA